MTTAIDLSGMNVVAEVERVCARARKLFDILANKRFDDWRRWLIQENAAVVSSETVRAVKDCAARNVRVEEHEVHAGAAERWYVQWELAFFELGLYEPKVAVSKPQRHAVATACRQRRIAMLMYDALDGVLW